MKLALIITDFGSFNNFLTELAKHIISFTNIELHVICSNDSIIDLDKKEQFKEGAINFHFLKIPRKISIISEFKCAKQIRKTLDEIKPDLVHVHFTTATFPTLLLKNNQYKYWATIHGLGMNASKGFRKLIFTAVESFSFLRLDKIFVVNEDDYRLTSRYFGRKTSKHKCYGFGCDISKFDGNNFSEKTISRKKDELGLTDDHFIIAFTGRFVQFKGFHFAVRAFLRLADANPGKYKLILIGGKDPIHPTGLKDSETATLSDHPDIINLGFTNEVHEYLSIADLFLFPSKKEGLPTCILEALAIGLPTVTFDARGNRDIIVDGYNGALVKQELSDDLELDSLCDALINLINDPEKMELFKKNALKNRQTYSRDRFVQEQIDNYTQFFECEPK